MVRGHVRRTDLTTDHQHAKVGQCIGIDEAQRGYRQDGDLDALERE
jgi:hypothetical protein